jgi:hypothetical protein
MMKTLTVRNVPDAVYQKLSDWARGNRRSLQEQLLYLLEEEVKLHHGSVMEAAEEYRTKLRGRQLGNIVGELREDRSR